MRKILIIGVVKGGTTSLEAYFRKHVNVEYLIRNVNLFTNELGPSIYHHKYPDYEPHVILREPAQRAYSDWGHRYSRHFTNKGFEDYLMDRISEDELKSQQRYYDMGDLDLVRMSNYEYWLHLWKDIPLVRHDLEEMETDTFFPHKNRGTVGDIDEYNRKTFENLLIIEKERVRMSNAKERGLIKGTS